MRTWLCHPKGKLRPNMVNTPQFAFNSWGWFSDTYFCKVFISIKAWLCHPKGQLQTKSVNLSHFFITEVNELMMIVLKYGDNCGHGCVRLRGRYSPTQVIPWNSFPITEVNKLMIILVKDGEQWWHGCVISRALYKPKGVYTLQCFYAAC